MNTYSYRQKINPSKDLKLLSQDWVFVKRQQNTDYPSYINTNIANNSKTENQGQSLNQNSFSDLRVQERSTAIPFCNGYQTFYTGIRDSSLDQMLQSKHQQNQSFDNFNLTSIMSQSVNKQNRSIYTHTQFNQQGGATFLPKSPYKRAIKSSRESSNKSTIQNSIQRFTGKDSSSITNSVGKPFKKLNQTMEVTQNDSHYDVMEQAAFLSSVYLPQNSSTSTVQAQSSEKKTRRRSSLFKNSNRKSKLQNNLSGSVLLNSSITMDTNTQAKLSQRKKKQDCIPEGEQNDIQKWSEHTAIFADSVHQEDTERLPQSQLKQNKNEVQEIIDGLFQEIEERDNDRVLEKEVMQKYKKQKMERLAKSQQDNKIQRVNNTNIVLSYSRGQDIQSNANGFQMSKYLYDQKYGHYKCIPQNYNMEVIPSEDQKLLLQLNKPDYTILELQNVPVKSIYNPEIDNNKKYLAATRVSEREQYQLKIPASTMMKKVLEKYDKDQKFIVSSVEQQDNQNIIQEVYGDFLQNPAKRLNISKIKKNQKMQNNLYDSRFVKPFIIEEENITEGNIFTNNSRNAENSSPSQRKFKEVYTFSKYYKPQETNRSQLPPEISQTPRSINGSNSPIITNKNRDTKNFSQHNTNNTYNFSNFLQPQKSIFSPQSSTIFQQSPTGRNTPLHFKRSPFETNGNSPCAPISRTLPKKKKINVKTNINEIGSIQEARISSPFVKVSEYERGMKQNVSTERQKFYDSWYSPPNERQENLDRHLNKYTNNIQYQKKLVQQYILLKSNGPSANAFNNKIHNTSLNI